MAKPGEKFHIDARGIHAEGIVTENGYKVSSGTDIGDIVTTLALDSKVTMSTTGEANCGSFWGSNPIDWRLYQNKNGDLTISVSSDYSLVSVKFTYSQSNGGSLFDGDTAISSGNTYSLSGTSKTYTVGSTTGKTNGQVKITAVEVTYE